MITERYMSWLNDPILMRYSNQRFKTHSFESCLQYQKSFDYLSNYFLAVNCVQTHQLIGTLTVYCNWNHLTADIGILIGDANYMNKGYAFESFKLCTEALIRGRIFRKITGGTLAINKPMIRIFEKCGFSLECIRKSQELHNGAPTDLHLYAKFA